LVVSLTPKSYQMKIHAAVAPGDLAIIKLAPDQGVYVRRHVGKVCLVIRRLTQDDGVKSSPNIWEVLVDGMKMNLHILDLTFLEHSPDVEHLEPG